MPLTPPSIIHTETTSENIKEHRSIVRYSDEILQSNPLEPSYTEWTWQKGTIKIAYNNYTKKDTFPLGEFIKISVDGIVTHIIAGLNELHTLWHILSDVCFEHGYMCELLEHDKRIDLPEHWTDL